MTDEIALWKQRILERKANGQTVTDWCKEHNVSKGSYNYWRRQVMQADCFCVPSLLQCLKENLINEVELVGVDGQFCVGMSALGATKQGFLVRYNGNCVGVRNDVKFSKMKNRLENAGVVFI